MIRSWNPAPQSELLILGLGNLLMGDDGLGVYAAEKLLPFHHPPEIDIVDGGTSLLLYLEQISRSRRLLVIDALFGNQPPGSLYRIHLDDISEGTNSFRTAHGITLPDVIGLARLLTGSPSQVTIIGAEPLECHPGVGISPPLVAALPRLVEQVIHEIRRHCNQKENVLRGP
ncbi:hydrogenase maturation protease [Heliobacterium chlorum]|uniref:Hydrogenase maturation protease n=1 Tax=Heliobacterium chlorum TaxID=2698 RepID=A0ABR7T198_HELCL|nr:hydrogenase maturation protease [Heliobacterium chlorum]MBC9784564.1 hydrogenase maturation protease [Heliobacterium chlorum]